MWHPPLHATCTPTSSCCRGSLTEPPPVSHYCAAPPINVSWLGLGKELEMKYQTLLSASGLLEDQNRCFFAKGGGGRRLFSPPVARK